METKEAKTERKPRKIKPVLWERVAKVGVCWEHPEGMVLSRKDSKPVRELDIPADEPAPNRMLVVRGRVTNKADDGTSIEEGQPGVVFEGGSYRVAKFAENYWQHPGFVGRVLYCWHEAPAKEVAA